MCINIGLKYCEYIEMVTVLTLTLTNLMRHLLPRHIVPTLYRRFDIDHFLSAEVAEESWLLNDCLDGPKGRSMSRLVRSMRLRHDSPEV